MISSLMIIRRTRFTLSYAVYDKNNPSAVLYSSAMISIMSTFTFDFDTNSSVVENSEIWFTADTDTIFSLNIYTSGVKCLAIIP